MTTSHPGQGAAEDRERISELEECRRGDIAVIVALRASLARLETENAHLRNIIGARDALADGELRRAAIEECAKVCDTEPHPFGFFHTATAHYLAKCIRALYAAPKETT